MKKTVDWYLQKGFDQAMAEYFASGRKKIIRVLPNDDFTLTLSFDNGETRLLDVSSMLLPGTVFEFLMDIANFRRVYLDETHAVSWDIDPNVDSNIVWNNKVDLCPDSCYVDSVPIVSAGGGAEDAMARDVN